MKFSEEIGCVTSKSRLHFVVKKRRTKKRKSVALPNLPYWRDRTRAKRYGAQCRAGPLTTLKWRWKVAAHNSMLKCTGGDFSGLGGGLRSQTAVSIITAIMKKALRGSQTLRAGGAKIFRPAADPLPGGARRPKFNQLEMITTFTYRPSLVRIDGRNFELSW